MATPRLARSPTCLSCLRRLAQPLPLSPLSPLSQTQTRAATTKAELEDLQGIPVRLLRDIPMFGRKHAIIRVKPGRMRNIWFPRGAAEYMTKKRFTEMGITEAAIGVRDRTFGTQMAIEEEQKTQKAQKAQKAQTTADAKSKRKAPIALPLPAEETRTLLQTLLPEVLVIPRTPVALTPPPPPAPVIPRSPSLAANAVTSVPSAAHQPSRVTPIFGSVSRGDILALVKERLLEDSEGNRVVLEPESVEILGLDAEHDGENRIKRLGTFEVRISPGVDSNGKGLEPIKFAVEVVAETS